MIPDCCVTCDLEGEKMKTIQELYNEIMANQELKAQFIEAASTGKQAEFLKQHDCQATAEEVLAFLKAKEQEDAPLSLDKLENAAGGECNALTAGETVVSVITLAVGCAVWGAVSKGGELFDQGHMGQHAEGDGRLCNL